MKLVVPLSFICFSQRVATRSVMAGWTGPANKVSRLSNPSDPPWRSSTNLGVSRPQPWPASQLGLGAAGLFSPVFSCLLLCSRSAGPPSLALPWQLTTADHFSVFRLNLLRCFLKQTTSEQVLFILVWLEWEESTTSLAWWKSPVSQWNSDEFSRTGSSGPRERFVLARSGCDQEE